MSNKLSSSKSKLLPDQEQFEVVPSAMLKVYKTSIGTHWYRFISSICKMKSIAEMTSSLVQLLGKEVVFSATAFNVYKLSTPQYIHYTIKHTYNVTVC